MFQESEFKSWLESKNLKERTQKEYLYYLSKMDSSIIPTQNTIDSFLERYNHGIARAFLNNLIRYYLRNLEETELTDQQIRVLQNIDIPKATGRKTVKIPRVLTADQVHEIEKHMRYERDKMMLLLSFYCGLRLGELIKLTVNSFNYQVWKKQVADGKEVDGEAVVFGKGDKEGTALVPYWLMARLRIWITKSYNNYFQSGRFTRDDKIFRIGTHRWHEILKVASEKALGFRVNPHLLRHSFATHLYNNGWDINEIKEMLRHSSVSSTEIYTHISKDKLKEKFIGISRQI